MASDGVQPRASGVQRYRFLRRLATGGMAEIYVADQVGVAGVKRRVAVKRILPAYARDPGFVTMFLTEARIAATLQHPNIVQTYDVIHDGGAYYIAMELLEGLSLLELRQRMHARQVAPTPGHVLYVIDRVLAGLHYAHEREGHDGTPLSIVHRDVSPHNVFLTRHGGVKLLDFGVAKVEAAFGRDQSGSGLVKGKVLYMSPEQCQGLGVDRTTDLHAVGALMYVLLTGTLPFRGSNPYDTMRAIIYNPVPAPSSIAPALGPEIDAIVTRALAKTPAERFPTARDMQQALAAVVRERGWYVTEVDFAAFVEGLLRETPSLPPDVANLPQDLVIGDGPESEEPVSEEPPVLSRQDNLVAETPHTVIERVGGLTVLTLRGVLDESFDASVARHVRGVVVVDTEDVRRVTSYGLRGLLEVIEASASQVNALYFVRASVAFVQQVGMIRRLLGGGRFVSFHLPYVDPVSGAPFLHLAAGPPAARMLRMRVPPTLPCPGTDRAAEFDEDPDGYLPSPEDFVADPPPHIARVIKALAAKEKRRQVEKEVTATGDVRIFIRRPLDDGFRWRTLLAGAQGAVSLDLDATPTWTDAGLDDLVGALEREAAGMTSLAVAHMPADLHQRLVRSSRLRALLRSGSIRLHAVCPSCATTRRMAVDLAALAQGRASGRASVSCPSCGREVAVSLGGPRASEDSRPRPVRRVDRRVALWLAAVGGLTLTVLLAILLLTIPFFR